MDAMDKPDAKMPLGQMLLGRGLITREQLDQALRIQVGGLRRLGSILVSMKVISAEALAEALASQLNLPVASIADEFKPEARSVLPRYLCRRYSALPLSLESHNVLRLAMADPLDAAAIADVESYTGHAVQPVFARLSDIEREIPERVSFSRQDLFNPEVYRSVARIAAAAAAALLLVIGYLVFRDVRTQRFGSVSRVDGSVIYKNHDLMIDLAGDGSVYLSGRGAYANGYYGVRFQNPQLLAGFVAGSARQFSEQQLAWMNWVFREKLKTPEPVVVAKRR